MSLLPVDCGYLILAGGTSVTRVPQNKVYEQRELSGLLGMGISSTCVRFGRRKYKDWVCWKHKTSLIIARGFVEELQLCFLKLPGFVKSVFCLFVCLVLFFLVCLFVLRCYIWRKKLAG